MYPRDAINLYISTTTPGTYTILPASTTPYTILQVNQFNLGSSLQRVRFGTVRDVVISSSEIHNESNIHTVINNQAITYVKSGLLEATVSIIYVPRNRLITPDPSLSAQSTSTTISNFPSGFNVNNWQLSTSTFINNPSLLVNCNSGCSGSSTITLGTTTVNIPNVDKSLTSLDMIYLILVTVGILVYIFKK